MKIESLFAFLDVTTGRAAPRCQGTAREVMSNDTTRQIEDTCQRLWPDEFSADKLVAHHACSPNAVDYQQDKRRAHVRAVADALHAASYTKPAPVARPSAGHS